MLSALAQYVTNRLIHGLFHIIRCNDVTQTQTESGREILQMQEN
jgi:hypothetical protein